MCGNDAASQQTMPVLRAAARRRKPLPSPSPPSLSFLCGSDAASQQTLPVLPEFELLPGDEIRTTCVWDSTSRSETPPSPLPFPSPLLHAPPPSSALLPPPFHSFPLLPHSPLPTPPFNPRLDQVVFGKHSPSSLPLSPLFPLFPLFLVLPFSPSPHPTTHGRTKASLSAFPLATISAPPQPAQPAEPQLTLPQPAAPQLTLPQPAAPQSGPLQSAAAASLHPSAAASPATPIVVVSPADTTVKAAPASAAASAANSALAAMLTALLCSILALFS
ncbi:unnamed protein product [Closterium sp. NIES-53]